ncbi:MAG: hypothetical protein ACRDOE_03525, partial [Streptosporangiaceae bacterium]
MLPGYRQPIRPERTIPRSSSGDCPAFRSAQADGQSCLVSGLAQQDRTTVADQPRPAAGDIQG